LYNKNNQYRQAKNSAEWEVIALFSYNEATLRGGIVNGIILQVFPDYYLKIGDKTMEIAHQPTSNLTITDLRRNGRSVIQGLMECLPLQFPRLLVPGARDNLLVRDEDDPVEVEPGIPALPIDRAVLLRQMDSTQISIPLVLDEIYVARLLADTPEDFTLTERESHFLAVFGSYLLHRIQDSKRLVCDKMTGLYNKEFLMSLLKARCMEVVESNQRQWRRDSFFTGEKGRRQEIAVILLDIDNFKRFNTLHGHLIGDAVLVATARTIFDTCSHRPGLKARAARFGGEEFVVVLSVFDKGEAVKFAEDLRNEITRTRVSGDRELHAMSVDSHPGGITCSLGLYLFKPEEEDLFREIYLVEVVREALARADAALHVAKENGKNQTVSYDEILTVAGKILRLIGEDEVLINLGEIHGIRSGMVFDVFDSEFNGKEPYFHGSSSSHGVYPRRIKAQVRINANTAESDHELQETISVGRITSQNPGWHMNKGDYIALNLQSSRLSTDQLEEIVDQLPREEVSACVQALSSAGALLCELAHPERLDRIYGSDARVRFVCELEVVVREKTDQEGKIFSFGRDGFCILLPETSEERTCYLGNLILDEISSRITLSFRANVGYAVWPDTCESTDLLESAARALLVARLHSSGEPVGFCADTINEVGNYYYELDRIEDAFKEYQKALDLVPGLSRTHNNLGIIYWELGLTDQAISSYKHSLELDGENVCAMNNLAYLYSLEQGKIDEAIRYYQEATRRGVDYPPAYNNLAHLFVLEGRNLKEAEELARVAVNLEPACGFFYDTLSRALYSLNKIEEAYQAIIRAIEIEGETCETLCHLSRILKDRNQFKDAEYTLDKALRMNPGYRPAKRLKFELAARKEYLKSKHTSGGRRSGFQGQRSE